MDKNIEELVKMIKEIDNLQQIVLKNLNREINYIINNKIVDDKKVESLFEDLLNLLQSKRVLNLYKKLGRYYYFVNSSLVDEYVNIYIDMYCDNEDEKSLIK